MEASQDRARVFASLAFAAAGLKRHDARLKVGREKINPWLRQSDNIKSTKGTGTLVVYEGKKKCYCRCTVFGFLGAVKLGATRCGGLTPAVELITAKLAALVGMNHHRGLGAPAPHRHHQSVQHQFGGHGGLHGPANHQRQNPAQAPYRTARSVTISTTLSMNSQQNSIFISISKIFGRVVVLIDFLCSR